MKLIPLKIAPSILSADFGKLNEEIAGLEKHADIFHVDVMDGHFVPNITIGAPVVRCIKSKKPLDVHLMIEKPEKYIEDFVKAGAATIVVHSEACKNLSAVLKKIKKMGVKCGVSIKPKTKVETIKKFLPLLDEVLVMTVKPGFGGQKFMKGMLGKVKKLRQWKPDLDIVVDGGINAETAKLCKEAGANVLVAGSFIFGAKNRVKALESLRG